MLWLIVGTAYPVVSDSEPFDQVAGEEDVARGDATEESIQQDTELDEVDVPGLPADEASRRANWKALPQRIRVAIRRLHRQFGHCPQKVLLNLLRAAKVDKKYIEACKFHRCNECETNAPRRNAHVVALPERYAFNHALGIDILQVEDAAGSKFQVLNTVCLGTCFQLTEIVKEGPGQATSAKCLKALQHKWTCWAGMPHTIRCDRGLHNRGVLAQFCSAHGIEVIHAPLETPEAIGRVERHGGALKAMFRKTVSQTQATGVDAMQTLLDECATIKNSMLRHGGYSPAQWVLGKTPTTPPSLVEEDNSADLGSLEDQASRFALIHQARTAAKQAFVCIWTPLRESRELSCAMQDQFQTHTP